MGIMDFNLARNLFMYLFYPFGCAFSSIQFSDSLEQMPFSETVVPQILKI